MLKTIVTSVKNNAIAFASSFEIKEHKYKYYILEGGRLLREAGGTNDFGEVDLYNGEVCIFTDATTGARIAKIRRIYNLNVMDGTRKRLNGEDRKAFAKCQVVLRFLEKVNPEKMHTFSWMALTRHVMEATGLSRQELATIHGVTYQTIVNWGQGTCKPCSTNIHERTNIMRAIIQAKHDDLMITPS